MQWVGYTVHPVTIQEDMMIKKLVYKLLNRRLPPKENKMKWVWYSMIHKENESNKFVDINKKMW